MSNNEISRKDFLKRISMVGAIGIGSSALLSACGGGNKEKSASSSTESKSMSSDKSDMASNESAAADPCTDLSSLSDSQKKMRETLKYTGKSPYPDKRCDNCNFFTAPESGKSCGSCSIVAGPINPKGHCTSWVAKQS